MVKGSIWFYQLSPSHLEPLCFLVAVSQAHRPFQSCSVDSLCPHVLLHARPPRLSLSPRVCSTSCLLSQWCYPTISSSATLFSCPQSFSASGSLLMSWLFPSSGQSTGVSVLASVLPMNIQGWFSLGLTGLISLELSKVFSSTISKHQLFGAQPSLWSSSHIPTWLPEKP